MRVFGKRVSFLFLLFLALAFGRSPAVSANKNELLDLSPWSRTTNLRGSFGYKDNVLLSATAPVDSPFWATELEFFLFRIPVDGTQILLFLTGEDIRFLNSQAPDKEQTLIALASVKKDVARSWKIGLTLQYLYQDQVFDVSTTEFGLNTVKVQAHTFTARPSLRRDFGPQHYAELEADISRHNFDAPVDDYWEGGPKLTLGHDYGPNSKISLSYQLRRWDYETRPERTPAGEPIPGTSLSFLRQDWVLTWQHPWDRKRRWRTTTKLSLARNSDSGSGYFEYTGYLISEQLRYVADPWEVRLQARFDDYYFPVQTVSDLDQRKRTKDGVGISLYGERKLNKSLKVYGQFQHEQSLSNRPEEEFDVNTMRIGIDWAF